MRSVVASLDQLTRPGRDGRRAELRRLKHLDALSAQLAELHATRAVLEQAARVIVGGWLQGAWFRVSTADGTRTVTAYDIRLTADGPVTDACLVGAVVQAAGGPAAVRSQLVQRTLDLLWHALRDDPDRPVRWCPGPRIRIMQVLDLTHWNDAPDRTQGEVVHLLRAARERAAVLQDRARVEQAAIREPELSDLAQSNRGNQG